MSQFYDSIRTTCGTRTLALVGSVANAQSGTRVQSNTRSQGGSGTVTRTTQGSSSRPAATNGSIALDGYCPVCIVDMKKWVKGNPAIQATYDGKSYYFPSNEQKETFLADPAKYVPALGGDCTVCAVNMGETIPGSIRHAALSHKRLYLFPSQEQQQEFMANAVKYVDVDLAYGGKCVVCRVEMNKDVAGKPEIAAYHQGLRYLFPSEEQRNMFLANPAKYATPSAANNTPARN
ncbi:MAG: hypothetical protein HYV60_02490 [Planctomycetia bacterium]|nr:hypothetical protein [Planctomycetia bacterium]